MDLADVAKKALLVGGAFLFARYLITSELEESKQERIEESQTAFQNESDTFLADFEKRGIAPLEELGAHLVAYREARDHCNTYAETLASKQTFPRGPRRNKPSRLKKSFLKRQRDACLESSCSSNKICTEADFREKSQTFRRMMLHWNNTQPKPFKPPQKVGWAIRHTNRTRAY